MNRSNILITGGAGFIGSHLCDRLLEDGSSVTALDDLSLGRKEFLARAQENKNFRFIQGDILDEEVLLPIFKEGKFDSVFHLAANSDIQRGGRETDHDLKLTFLTTFRILDAMRKFNVRQLFFASSSAIYGEATGKIGENHGPVQPVSFYGAGKLAAEAYISAFAHHFMIRSWIYRFPNVIGPRLTHGVVHDFIKKLQNDPGKLPILGDGTQEKPYLHVTDLIDAMLLCRKKLSQPLNCVNIGVESRTTVRRIAEIVTEEMGLKNVEFQFSGGPRGWAGDVPFYQYDLSRVKGLGWRARLTSEQAIRRAVREAFKR